MEELEVLQKIGSIGNRNRITLKKTEIAEYLLSIDGMGVVSLATCLGELENPLRFKDARHCCKQ